MFSVAFIFDHTLRVGRCSPCIEDTTMQVTLVPADAHNPQACTRAFAEKVALWQEERELDGDRLSDRCGTASGAGPPRV